MQHGRWQESGERRRRSLEAGTVPPAPGGPVSSGPLVLVGTDGSYTSFRAVERAAQLAADKDGSLLIVSAYLEPSHHDQKAAEDEMGDMGHQFRGSNPAEAALRGGGGEAEGAARGEGTTASGTG